MIWAAGGREELYDLQADPGERNNIAGSEPRLAKSLRARVLDWERENGLSMSFEGGQFKTFEEPKPPADPPSTVVFNEGQWPDNLPLDEQGSVETYAEAFSRAISRETSLSPEKLSLGLYKKRGGHPLIGTPWEAAWRKA